MGLKSGVVLINSDAFWSLDMGLGDTKKPTHFYILKFCNRLIGTIEKHII
jgi:hypothetical protein